MYHGMETPVLFVAFKSFRVLKKKILSGMHYSSSYHCFLTHRLWWATCCRAAARWPRWRGQACATPSYRGSRRPRGCGTRTRPLCPLCVEVGGGWVCVWGGGRWLRWVQRFSARRRCPDVSSLSPAKQEQELFKDLVARERRRRKKSNNNRPFFRDPEDPINSGAFSGFHQHMMPEITSSMQPSAPNLRVFSREVPSSERTRKKSMNSFLLNPPGGGGGDWQYRGQKSGLGLNFLYSADSKGEREVWETRNGTPRRFFWVLRLERKRWEEKYIWSHWSGFFTAKNIGRQYLNVPTVKSRYNNVVA